VTIRVGTAPDSWDVWFPDDPRQTPYPRFLDEVVAAGYSWIELGPYGYLPTDPEKLRDELGSRGLQLSAGTVFKRLHQEDSWSDVWSQVEAVARLTAAVGGTHVVVIPEMWPDPATGAARAQYHPHADSHVDTDEHVYRFLDCTTRFI
jgi:inosose dehydratase